MDESLRDAWERHAHDWAAWARRPGFDSYWRFGRDAFFALLPPPGRLTLDVGCGEGRVARDLAARGHRVRGVDGSATLVALAREASPQLDFAVADAAALPSRTASRTWWSPTCRCRTRRPRGAVRDVARVLEPGGRLCAAIVHPLNSPGAFATDDVASAFVVDDSYLATRRTTSRSARGLKTPSPASTARWSVLPRLEQRTRDRGDP